MRAPVPGDIGLVGVAASSTDLVSSSFSAPFADVETGERADVGAEAPPAVFIAEALPEVALPLSAVGSVCAAREGVRVAGAERDDEASPREGLETSGSDATGEDRAGP